MLKSLKDKLLHLTDDEFEEIPGSELFLAKIKLMTMSDQELSLLQANIQNSVSEFVSDIIKKRLRKRNYIEQIEKERLFRNETVNDLLALYTYKKSGKVVDSRTKLQKRYMYISYDEQLLVMKAMLKGTKTDREWCYNTLRKKWTDEISNDVIDVWCKYKEERCGWLITKNFSIDLLRQYVDDLSYESNYYNLCKRLISQNWFHIDKDKLRNSCEDDSKYLWIMSQTSEKVTEHEALEILYHWISRVLCIMNKNIVYDFNYNKYKTVYKILPDPRMSYYLSMTDYEVVENMLVCMFAMGMEKAVEHFIDKDTSIHYEFCKKHNSYIQDLSGGDSQIIEEYATFYAESFPDEYKCFFKHLPTEKKDVEEKGSEDFNDDDDSFDDDDGISWEDFEYFCKKHPYISEIMNRFQLEPIINDNSDNCDNSEDLLPF